MDDPQPVVSQSAVVKTEQMCVKHEPGVVDDDDVAVARSQSPALFASSGDSSESEWQPQLAQSSPAAPSQQSHSDADDAPPKVIP